MNTTTTQSAETAAAFKAGYEAAVGRKPGRKMPKNPYGLKDVTKFTDWERGYEAGVSDLDECADCAGY